MRSTSMQLAVLCAVVASCGGSGSSTAPRSPVLSVSLPSGTMTSGTSMQATALLDGAATTGVTWSTSNAEILSVTNTGLLTAAFAGTAAVTATKGSAQGTALVVVTPGPPATIWVWSGNLQSAPAGTTLKDPPAAAILDAAANLVKGVTVTFTVATGGGSLAAPTTTTTNDQGVATAGAWTLGPTKGSQTVVASSGTLTPVTFTATAQ